MKKKQWLLAGGGMVLLCILFFFGNTAPPASSAKTESAASPQANALDIKDILEAAKSRLSPAQLERINRLEHSVVRGDVKHQQIAADLALAAYWRDSIGDAFLPVAWYTADAAKLENSEKSLNFAALLFLNSLRSQDNPLLRSWMAGQSRELFERALELDPSNDSLKIGRGATYIFGGSADPADVMKGIQALLEIARRDSSNMYTQFMLALGGMESGQYEKAAERLEKVVAQEPRNMEAMLNLGEAYEKQGKKTEAVRWYREARNLTRNDDLLKALDERIRLLK